MTALQPAPNVLAAAKATWFRQEAALSNSIKHYNHNHTKNQTKMCNDDPTYKSYLLLILQGKFTLLITRRFQLWQEL